MAKPVLYGISGSRALRSIWAIEEVGIDYEHVPTHFGDTPGFLPHQKYSRFGAIFQVADTTGAPLRVAEFKGVSYSLDGQNYETAENHIAVYWQDVNEN